MYKIIGTDQKEYGPVSLDQIRQWVAEGRANANTMARLEGATDWKPLSTFPELASLFIIAPPPLASSSYAAYDQRKSKLVAGLLGILLGGLGVHRFYLGYTGIGILQIVVTIVTCCYGWVWGFIEGILIIAGSTITTDAEGRPLKE